MVKDIRGLFYLVYYFGNLVNYSYWIVVIIFKWGIFFVVSGVIYVLVKVRLGEVR